MPTEYSTALSTHEVASGSEQDTDSTSDWLRMAACIEGSAARIRVGRAAGQLYSVQRASCKCECVMANRWNVVPSYRTRVRDPTANM